jgi:hypothetical protein
LASSSGPSADAAISAGSFTAASAGHEGVEHLLHGFGHILLHPEARWALPFASLSKTIVGIFDKALH